MIDRCRVRSGAVLATGLLFIVGCGAGDDASNWTEHKSEGGNFSALFPQEAKEKKEGPGIEVLAASPSEGGSYSVMVQDLQEFEKGKEPKEIMDSYLKTQGDFMTVSDVEPTKAAGFPATRFKLADKKNPEAAAQSSLMIIAEGRQYIMSVITAADSHSDANVKKFFDADSSNARF